MRRKLYALATRLQAKLLESGLAHMQAADRDAWSSLYRWHQSGEKVWRIDGPRDPLPDDLPLADAPTIAPAMLYQLDDRSEWFLVARHAAQEPIAIRAPEMVWAYPESMLTYVTAVDGAMASGAVNLRDMSRPADLWLPAGRNGKRWLEQDDVRLEEQRMRRVLPFFFRS